MREIAVIFSILDTVSKILPIPGSCTDLRRLPRLWGAASARPFFRLGARHLGSDDTDSLHNSCPSLKTATAMVATKETPSA